MIHLSVCLSLAKLSNASKRATEAVQLESESHTPLLGRTPPQPRTARRVLPFWTASLEEL